MRQFYVANKYNNNNNNVAFEIYFIDIKTNWFQKCNAVVKTQKKVLIDNQSFVRECLEAHNQYRKKHSVPPMNLNKKVRESYLYRRRICNGNILYDITSAICITRRKLFMYKYFIIARFVNFSRIEETGKKT